MKKYYEKIFYVVQYMAILVIAGICGVVVEAGVTSLLKSILG